jgi:two-component system NtrC family sensor kinase
MRERLARLLYPNGNGIRIPISTKLMLSFLLIITIISAVFVAVGIRLIGDRIVNEAQDQVRHDLNAAREIYLDNLRHINDVVQLTANRFFLKDALMSENYTQILVELAKIRESEDLDILTFIDPSGEVLSLREDEEQTEDDLGDGDLVRFVLSQEEPIAATSIVSEEILRGESQLLAIKASFTFVETPRERARVETSLTDGMMLEAAAPIFDYQNNLIGVLLGGVLLNRNFEIVDKIKETVYENLTYGGKNIGTATIFQDDVRVSTNVRNVDGSRALGTRVSEEVYNQVVQEGEPWIGRAYVVNDWYITAYEPIRDLSDQVIGILYVGILEQKYVDIQRQTVLAFLVITLLGALGSMLLSYFISQRISVPIAKLAHASRDIADGNLDTNVEITSKDELGELSDSFNVMATALKQRDEQLKEFTRSKIMESERLALIGQLAASVAHELNNPLQGIVTYSHLLLEEIPADDSRKSSVQRIVTQANRCRDIIRGLLDFSRQRKPDKTVCDINSVMQECIKLVEHQALFHNIQIDRQLDHDLPMIVVDPSQMQQVFINMIINAAEAMDDGGNLRLNTRLGPREEFIEIEFADTGSGIHEEHINLLFDPFFTTKEVGHGTGLGLAISYGIVKEHKGTISVETEVDEGTSFLIRLPVNNIEGADDGR